MAGITLFSTPKPFTDPFIATIQRNALRSWSLLGPEVEARAVSLEHDKVGLAERADAHDASGHRDLGSLRFQRLRLRGLETSENLGNCGQGPGHARGEKRLASFQQLLRPLAPSRQDFRFARHA